MHLWLSRLSVWICLSCRNCLTVRLWLPSSLHPLSPSLTLSSFIIYWNIGTFETSSQIRKTNKINVNNGHHQQNAKSTTLHVLRREGEGERVEWERERESGREWVRCVLSDTAIQQQIRIRIQREREREREGLTRGTFAQTVARQRLKLCVHVCVCLYKYNKKRLKNNNNNKQQQQQQWRRTEQQLRKENKRYRGAIWLPLFAACRYLSLSLSLSLPLSLSLALSLPSLPLFSLSVYLLLALCKQTGQETHRRA